MVNIYDIDIYDKRRTAEKPPMACSSGNPKSERSVPSEVADNGNFMQHWAYAREYDFNKGVTPAFHENSSL